MSEEETLPLGWSECKLGEVLKLKNGYAFKSGDFVDKDSDTVPVIRISNIDGTRTTDDNAVHIHKSKIMEGLGLTQGPFSGKDS